MTLSLFNACTGHSAEVTEENIYSGMCDASAGIALSSDIIIVADDESNALFKYSRKGGAAPLEVIKLDRFLQADRKHPEADIEGAARVGDTVFWITSHGRNKDGEVRQSRQRFFATRVVSDGIRPEGRPYKQLLADFAADPKLKFLNLRQASTRAPKAEEGLNIEGLVARPDGTLLIAFRNPIPDEKGLLLPLLNPQELVTGGTARAKFGEPILLELEGRGVRDITYAGGSYYLIAGSRKGGGKSQLYSWDGTGQPTAYKKKFPSSLNPEALLPLPSGHEMLILSDDGGKKVGGLECKDLKPEQRRFRSFLLTFELEPPK